MSLAFQQDVSKAIRTSGVKGEHTALIVTEAVLASLPCCGVLCELLSDSTHLQGMFTEDEVADITRAMSRSRVASDAGTDTAVLASSDTSTSLHASAWQLFQQRVRTHFRVVVSSSTPLSSLRQACPSLFASCAVTWWVPLPLP